MKFGKALLILVIMSLLIGCGTNGSVTVIGECSWSQFIYMEDDEIDDIVKCCRNTADQIAVHNELYLEYCD